jgi:hypothetical protein
MHPRRATLVLSIFAATVLVAACGTSTASTAPGESGSAATPGGQGTPAPGATPGPQATVGNVGGAANSLSNLSSYKVSVTGTGGTGPFSVEIVVINKPTKAESLTETAGSVSFRVIEIGTDNWVDTGSGTFVKNSVPAGSLDSMMSAFDPGALFAAANSGQELAALQNVGIEQKNGVQAIHLHGDQNTQVPAGSSPIPAGANVDLWLAVDGQYLVALEATGFSSSSGALTNFNIEITNINDSSLTVSPPS